MEAQFGDEAFFLRTKYSNKALFMNTKFGDKALFDGAQFGKASFWSAQFGNGTSFRVTKFGNETTFVNLKFRDQLSFCRARFIGETLFQSIPFEQPNTNVIDFTGVVFEKPHQVHMHNMDMNSIALVRTNVQDVNFLDCTWPTIGKRYGVFDEIYYSKLQKSDHKKEQESERFLEPASLEEIEQLYLRLQSNCESNKRYDEAGDFYIGAMEMRRLQIAQNKNWLKRWLRQNVLSLEAWYRNVSFYGERWTRTLLWMLLVVFLFPAIYLLSGFEYPAMNPMNGQYTFLNYDLGRITKPSQLVEDYLKALDVSFHTFTFQRDPHFRLTTIGRFISVFESAISATLLALFLLAIRRRFRR
jgi:hypothetical protein